MQGVFDFLNQGWVGSLVGIIGVIVGLFLYKRSTRTATPAYQKSSLRLLGQNEDILPEEVTVFFKDEEIARLTRTILILWNNGSEVLYGDKIVAKDPIRISFDAGDTILGFRILKRSTDVNDFSVRKDNPNPHQLTVSFSYLDPGDGASVELLHDSEKRYPEVRGSIMGLPKGFKDLGIVSTEDTPLPEAARQWRLRYWRPF